MSFFTKDGLWLEGDDGAEFVIPDKYYVNPIAEELLQSLKVRLNEEYPTTKVYISTASQDVNWLWELYKKNKEVQE